MDDILFQIHKINPYLNFDYSKYPLSVTGWYSEDPVFQEIIRETRPKLIIEVGTWKGASAIYMASFLRDQGYEQTKIICIDTWLGSIDFWTDQEDEEKYSGLQTVNGYPTVYYQFLANVMHKNLQDYIIPFPQPAKEAWQWLTLNKIKADFIYIDANHNYDEIFNDVHRYWDLLNLNGIICGDDYDQYWPTVKTAINCLVNDNDFDLTVKGNKWFIRKNQDSPLRKEDDPEKIITQLYTDMQTIQHDYLQHQKMHNKEQNLLQKEHNSLLNQLKKQEKQLNGLQDKYQSISRMKVVALARTFGRIPLVQQFSDLIDKLTKREN